MKQRKFILAIMAILSLAICIFTFLSWNECTGKGGNFMKTPLGFYHCVFIK